MATDCLIVGGGVIGLSLAWELAQHGRKVCLIDRDEPGRAASWAGAGMLPPGIQREDDSPVDQFHGLSYSLHADWAERLREQTGLDNGYRRTGAVYLARDPSERRESAARIGDWQQRGIVAETLDAPALSRLEPALAVFGSSENVSAPLAWLVPGECQIRNPRHVRALTVACVKAGVEILPRVEADDFQCRDGRVMSVVTSRGTISADQVCIATGSWTGRLAKRIGITVPVRPVRGQMLLLRDRHCRLTRIVNEGPRYLVPRGDGLVLVGSTEEEAGFDCSTTAGGIRGLAEFAASLCPPLADASVERTWAGLRPGTVDGNPYLGLVPGFENLYLAAGHFRAGLLLSPATAVVMRQLMTRETVSVDLKPFRLDRHCDGAV